MTAELGAHLPARVCDACGKDSLRAFSDLGDLAVDCGIHLTTEAEALRSPVGRVILGYCPQCAYVRNLVFDGRLIDESAPTDMNLQHSAIFREFTSSVVSDLAARLPLAGKEVLEVGCAQGELLRELCEVTSCTGVGFDASYTGPPGADGSGAVFHPRPAPLDGELPPFDLVISRFVLEHVADPYKMLVRLREHAADRPAAGHFQVPDAEYDLTTAGWDVIYPHVSYFGASALHHLAERAGWQVESTRSIFSGLIRQLEVSHGVPMWQSSPARTEQRDAARDQLLEQLATFDQRHHAERARWQQLVEQRAQAGDRPVLWGAGSRGVQFLHLADRQRRLAAVVDVNPQKWGRYLPVTGHRVDEPDALRGSGTRVVIITNPVYQDEIAESLHSVGVSAELLVA